MPARPARLAIIGAGPIGISAALLARDRGLDVTVFEAGEVGDAVRRWGSSTRLFSPMRMNLPDRAFDLLGPAAPDAEALMTGPDLAQRVLAPLAASAPLAGRVLTRHRVRAVGRAGLTRGELAGHPLRAERPFRLLVESPEGEMVFEADRVLDASGVYGRPAWAGTGGIPARGERETGSRIIRHLGDLESKRERLAGRRLLLIGHGHSAANALLVLERLAAESPDTHVTWAVRTPNRRPVVEVAGDPLPERQRVACRANDLAAQPPAFLTVRRRVTLEAIAPEGNAGDAPLIATLAGPGAPPGGDDRFDEAIALTGYRPDMGILSELAVEISPVTEGAARLARALAGVTDCLSAPAAGPGDLDSGEPGFALIGAKSYGRSSTFLLKTGLTHLRAILEGFAP